MMILDSAATRTENDGNLDDLIPSRWADTYHECYMTHTHIPHVVIGECVHPGTTQGNAKTFWQLIDKAVPDRIIQSQM